MKVRKTALILSSLLSFETLLGVNPCVVDPWYMGTVLEFNSTNLLAGQFDIQPFIFAGAFYGSYDNNWSMQPGYHFDQINAQFYFQQGITHYFQILAFIQTLSTFYKKQSVTYFGDSLFSIAFQFMWEEKNTPKPNIRLVISETFPTGKYQHLDPHFNSLDASGSGSYQTQIALVVKKNFYTIPCHPFNLNFNVGYTFATNSHVRGFNAYGGDSETNGSIHVPQKLLLALATEYSFTQNWVFALDIQYTHTRKTKFSGDPGRSNSGSLLNLSRLPYDLITMTPAIEYNFSPNLGFLIGAAFSVIGRNTFAFAEGEMTVTYTF